MRPHFKHYNVIFSKIIIPTRTTSTSDTQVVGDNGQLFLQTWSTDGCNADILITGDVYVGKKEGIRVGLDNYNVSFNNIYLTNDSSIYEHSDNQNHSVSITGTVTDKVPTAEEGTYYDSTSTLTLRSTIYNISGTVDVAKLVIDDNAKVTFEANSNLVLNSTVDNKATLTLAGTVPVKDWSGFEYTVVGGDDAMENGLFDMGKKYILISGNELAEGSTTTFTYDGTSYNIADGYTESEGQIYAVVSDTVTVGGTGATEGTADADAFLVKGGTLALAEGSLSKNILNYTSGSISLADNTSITDLTTGADASLIASVTGTGTMQIAKTESGYGGTIASNSAFTGTTYVTSGSFTLNGSTFGNILQLGNDVNMQITANYDFSKNMVLDAGEHQIHTNGNTLTISGTVSGNGTLVKKASGSINIVDGASVNKYRNDLNTTNVQGGSIADMTVAGGTTNVSGGLVTNLTSTGGTTNVSGGTVGHIVTTGGTLNLTGTATIDGSGNTGNYRVAGIFANGGTVNVGNGTDTATVTTTRIEMGDTAAGALNIRQNATLVVTGSDVVGGDGSYANAYWKTGFLLSEWNGQSTLNVTGTLLVQNAHVAHGDNTAYVNIENGGVIATKGLYGARNHGAANANGRIQLNLKDGGTLIVGDGGIDVSNLDGSLAAGTIGISADATIADNLALSSATGTTFDTQKWVWGENGAAISQGTEGGTLTISGTIADYSTTTGEGDSAVTTTSTGKLIKTGAGTLKLTATNTYSGGTDINGGTLEVGASGALGSGEVNIDSAGTLTIANGATFTNTIKGAGTYALGSSTTLQGTLDSTWTGTVVLEGATLTDADLNAYGNASSAVELKKVSGSLTEGTINTNVKLTLANDTPGVKINNTTGKTVTFAGAVSGNGNFVVQAANTSADDYKADTYVFSGDVSNWNTANVGFISATDANVEFTGKATTINNGIYANGGTLNATISGDKAVTVNGDITNKKWTTKGTLNLTVNNTSTEGVTFINTVKADTATIAAGSKATFTGTTNLDTISLGAGLSADYAAITTSGALTLGKFELDLRTYTEAGEFLLVSKTGDGSINWTEGSWSQSGLAGGLTANVGFNDAGGLSLTISDVVVPDTKSLTTTISDVSSLFDSENNMLTLNIGADDSLANVDTVTISGISDDIMKQILGLDGLPEDGMVGITLLDKDGEKFIGGITGDLVFRGNTGVYEGVVSVDSATQYNVAYIPEPTTATLSLLALAGLAMRRRRASR